LSTPVRTELLQVNFPPKAKLYVHRVGRCARAGRRSTIVGTAPPPSPRFPSPTRLYSATRARADRRSSMQRSAAASAATRQRSPRPLRACPRRAHTRAVCSGKSYSLVSLDERAYLLDLFTFLGVEPQVSSYFGSHAAISGFGSSYFGSHAAISGVTQLFRESRGYFGSHAAISGVTPMPDLACSLDLGSVVGT
jgi:hypothetical protein